MIISRPPSLSKCFRESSTRHQRNVESAYGGVAQSHGNQNAKAKSWKLYDYPAAAAGFKHFRSSLFLIEIGSMGKYVL